MNQTEDMYNYSQKVLKIFKNIHSFNVYQSISISSVSMIVFKSKHIIIKSLDVKSDPFDFNQFQFFLLFFLYII